MIPIWRKLDIYGATTESELEARLATHCMKRRIVRSDRTGALVVPAYVNHNRWVANCPDCNGGMGADPAQPTAICWDCGGEFVVSPPPDWRRAEKILERRAPKHRHWLVIRESLDDLEEQNRQLARRGLLLRGDR